MFFMQYYLYCYFCTKISRDFLHYVFEAPNGVFVYIIDKIYNSWYKSHMNATELKQHWTKTIELLKANPDLLRDKRWRLENLYVINTKSKGKRIFKLTRAQNHFLDNIRNRNIILKSRQLGFSTLITLWILDETLFKPNKEALAIAHVKEGMTDIFDKKAKFAIMNFPDEIKGIFDFKTNSKTKLTIQFADGSQSTFGVALSGRSGTYQYVHISEYAKLSKMFPQRAEEVMTGTLPAVPMDGFVFIESTAEGASGSYYDTYMDALDAKSRGSEALFKVQFYPHFYNWTWDDMELDNITEIIPVSAMQRGNVDWESYQKQHNLSDKEMTYYYMRWLSLKKDVERLNQEYPTTPDEAFISTGKPYFDQKKILECKMMVQEPEYYDIIGREIVDVYAGPLMVWKKPDPKRAYVVGGDTAEGLHNGDYSTLTIIDVETREIVAIYKSQIPPDEFYDVCFAVATWYNTALLAVEVNKDGLWVNNELERNGYTNLYYRQRIDDVTKQIAKTFGWRTDRQSRDSMLTELRSVFSDTVFTQAPLLDEMLSFVRNARGKPEAVLGKHDDVIMATAIAYMVRKLWYVENFKSQDTKSKPSTKMDLIFMNMKG